MTDRTTTLRELGRRLSARREESRLDALTLAARASVDAEALACFERGEGGLGVGALTRLARELAVPVETLISVEFQEVRAPTAPSAMLLATGTASLREADRALLEKALTRARAFVELGELLGADDLAERFSPNPAPARKAHVDGYATARSVRLELPDYRARPIDELTRLIEDRFDILVVRAPFENPAILGAACRSGDAKVIVVNSAVNHLASIRMTLAHELCHHLKDLDTDGVRVDDDDPDAGFTFENPPEEKRARAFAAMLLAPEDAVLAHVGGHKVASELKTARALVLDARHFFGMGYEAMTWHLHSLGYLPDRDLVTTLLRERDLTEIAGFERLAGEDGLVRRANNARKGDLISEARYRELLGASLV